MTQNNRIVFYHDDLDGITAAAIVNHFYPDTEFVSVNYGDMWKPEEIEGKEVWVVDFSFPNMRELAEACDSLDWIDHHRTAMEQQREAWEDKNIFGIRSLEKSGCELTWDYLKNPEARTPNIISLVGDMDMWQFKYKNTRAVCEAAVYELTDPKDNIWEVLFGSPIFSEAAEEDLEIHGSVLLEAKRRRVEQLFNHGTDITFFGHRARIMNATTDISTLGEYVYKQDDYDMAVMWQVINNEVILSFRSDTVDVGEIAESFGGGGHKAASGATVDFRTLLNIMEGVDQ